MGDPEAFKEVNRFYMGPGPVGKSESNIER